MKHTKKMRRNPNFDNYDQSDDQISWGKPYSLSDEYFNKTLESINSREEKDMLKTINSLFYKVLSSLSRINSSFNNFIALKNQTTVSFHESQFDNNEGFLIVPLGNTDFADLMNDVGDGFAYLHIKISTHPQSNFFSYRTDFKETDALKIQKEIQQVIIQIERSQRRNDFSNMLKAKHQQDDLIKHLIEFQKSRMPAFGASLIISFIELARQLQDIELQYIDVETGRPTRRTIESISLANHNDYGDASVIQDIYDACFTLIEQRNQVHKSFDDYKNILASGTLANCVFSREGYNVSKIVTEVLSILELLV